MSYSCLEKRSLTFVDKLAELDEEEDECIGEKDRIDIREDKEEMTPNLSYEAFLDSIVPIGYKFECEEENDQEKNGQENKTKDNEKVEPLELEERKLPEIKIEELSLEEIKALAGDNYLKGETINNRVVVLSDKRKEEKNKHTGLDKQATKEKSAENNETEKTGEGGIKDIELNGKENKDISTEEIQGEMGDSNKGEEEHNKSQIECVKDEKDQNELYIAWGEEVVNARKRARKLLQEFNHADPEDRQLTYSILKKLLGEVGEYVHIEPNFKCSYGKNIKIGDNFYAGYNCVILDQAEVRIGCNCIISSQVGIYTLAYPLDYEKRIAGYEYAKPITIGDNVWIGGGSIINPGVIIGDNVVIATGSVITGNIPSNVMVEGNPARIIKQFGRNK